ncbi:DNA ligase [Marinobacter daepoensis]|uniref:DNA ligase n=1 Tax=Marinobacter daepoensis TaxID=262077 RepID=A0ABS3BEG7_9GAMM|nr:DNA ligase [Marinobacter daepoensis]MBN7770147.1 DNA ligase [Marinobacter daepoensis]MBY6033677.1 DNA ligase [Marinobacter daepoensis]MBY6079593.1 DNA ligase [Marinobacter daepoensis]
MPRCTTGFARAVALASHLFCFLAFLPALALAQTPAIPLANVYHQGVNLQGYWVSEKLDGVRAYWDGDKLWSRGGHVYAAPEWFVAHFPEHPMDGELWSGRGRFAELSGVVRKSRPEDREWREVRFHVFDIPAEGVPFEQRYRRLKSLVRNAGSRYLAVVNQSPVESHQVLMAKLDRAVDEGAEGLMLKRKAGLYRAGRSDDLLKVKQHQDAEATVVGYRPGNGKYDGMMGALEVELDDGRRFRLGTGFSEAERQNPPPVGARVTFRYRGLTATGLPRFASFQRIRNDEPERR